MLNPRQWLVIALSLFTLAACGGPNSPLLPSPSPLAPTPYLLIPPGGSVLHTLPPDANPTAASPILHLAITVADSQTRQLLLADITVDNTTARTVARLDVYVDANTPHTVTVTCPGYLPWSVRVETHLEHDKLMTLPVLLEPLPPTPQPGA